MKNLLLIATLFAAIPVEAKPNVVFIMADRVYSKLKRYGNYVGGPLLTKRNKIFRSPSGKKFLRFWIALGKKENKNN